MHIRALLSGLPAAFLIEKPFFAKALLFDSACIDSCQFPSQCLHLVVSIRALFLLEEDLCRSGIHQCFLRHPLKDPLSNSKNVVFLVACFALMLLKHSVQKQQLIFNHSRYVMFILYRVSQLSRNLANSVLILLKFERRIFPVTNHASCSWF